jgi:hypothetical protein
MYGRGTNLDEHPQERHRRGRDHHHMALPWQAGAFAPPSVPAAHLPTAFGTPSEVGLRRLSPGALNSRCRLVGGKHLPITFRPPSVFAKAPPGSARRASTSAQRRERSREMHAWTGTTVVNLLVRHTNWVFIGWALVTRRPKTALLTTPGHLWRSPEMTVSRAWAVKGCPRISHETLQLRCAADLAHNTQLEGRV